MQSANEGEGSPVTEVYLYEQKELLRRQIAGRTDQAILNLFSTDDHASVPADDETVISLVGESDESGGDADVCSDVAAAGMPVAMNINVSVSGAFAKPVAIPVATAVPVPNNTHIPAWNPGVHPAAEPVSATLIKLLQEIQSNKANKVLDPPECKRANCPYCTGGLMAQRYMLARRLVQLEEVLFGT